MTSNKQLKQIKQRMTDANIKVGTLIMASGYTNLRGYLSHGADIGTRKLDNVLEALARLESAKASD
jgi:hypothetical protein